MVSAKKVAGAGLAIGGGVGLGLLAYSILKKPAPQAPQVPDDIKYIMSQIKVEFDAVKGFEDIAPAKTIDGLSFDRWDVKLLNYVDSQKRYVSPGERGFQGSHITLIGIDDLIEDLADDWKDLILCIRKWGGKEGEYLIQVVKLTRYPAGCRIYYKGSKIYDSKVDGDQKLYIWLSKTTGVSFEERIIR